jgi:gamma-glutamylcyclotransferase (GGCT)/AIG2-like uncharacterized protein YtfP
MNSIKEKKKVAVYGTLRGMLPEENLVRKNDRIKGLAVSLGQFPALVSLDDKFSVEVDVYEVDRMTLEYLDNYEGVPAGLYKRVTTTTASGDEVIVYLFNKILDSWRYKDGQSQPQISYKGNVYE